MNKFKYYFILIITTLALFSCSKNNDTVEVVPLRDYQEQFNADNIAIEDYLNSHYITVTNTPGLQTDQDVIYTLIPDGGSQPSIMSYLNSATFPKLLTKEVVYINITYTIYYLVLREGSGESPSNVDGVFTAYRGTLLDDTVFDTSTNEQNLFNLDGSGSNGVFVQGWKEIFPKFKTGNYSENNDGTVTYSDFGAGVMFIPSGLAYYSQGAGSIPSYSPIVFSFKLYEIKRYDHDGDGILSYLEDLDGDGYVRVLTSDLDNPDDTDKDGVPDFLDVDDDGDSYTTKLEIKDPVTELPYAFNVIPSCDGNTTNPARIKKHLDKTCH